MIILEQTKRTDPHLLERMKIHYSQPKGFVGRNICYAVYYNSDYYGHIVGGSATLHLKGRNEFFNISKDNLTSVVNNLFFNISTESKYPERNFTTKVLLEFEKRVKEDWFKKYQNELIGAETLIEYPRTGELYRRAGWIKVGNTIGYTCKRIAGKGTDSWSGKRIWDTKTLRPKLILCKRF